MAGILFALLLSWNLLSAPRTGCEGKKIPKFEDYPSVDTFEGKAHPPVLATALDRNYKTRIRDTAAEGADFSGHFAIASWGCGTGCLQFVIVDLKSGKVYDPPFLGVGFHYRPGDYDPTPGWQCYTEYLMYRRNSKLLIVEGCLIRGKQQCGRTSLVMEGGQLKQVSFDQTGLKTGQLRLSNSR
jgi:hypothetical protein